MAWRAVNSILVLRDQVDALAPNRAKGADGTVCDENHPTTSDHCPHYVAGLGANMVTALDLTHDPDGGFNSYLFAEDLRKYRDPRIKYVISNEEMFSSYATSQYPAWTWRPYSGADLHTNHVHVSVLDAVISDTKTAWRLDMEQSEQLLYKTMYARRDVGNVITDLANERDWWFEADGGTAATGRPSTNSRRVLLYQRVADTTKDVAELKARQVALDARLVDLSAKLDQILAKLGQPVGGTFPANSTFTSSTTGTIIWNPQQ